MKMSGTLQIGETARKLGINPKTIRYYEELGLLPEPSRAPNGYRQYRQADVERIEFIRRARSLDLSLQEIDEILQFREEGEVPCPYVLHLLQDKINQVEDKISGLRDLNRELKALFTQASSTPPEILAAKGHVCHIIENRQLETNT